MNEKFNQEIKDLYEKTDKSQPFEQFKRLYNETATTNLDGLFAKTALNRELNKDRVGKSSMQFAPQNTDSNLTPEQAKQFEADRVALGYKPATVETVKLAADEKTPAQIKSEKFHAIKKEFGDQIEMGHATYLLCSIEEEARIDALLIDLEKLGRIKKLAPKLSLLDQAILEKNWK